jgi:hypothetical protein
LTGRLFPPVIRRLQLVGRSVCSGNAVAREPEEEGRTVTFLAFYRDLTTHHPRQVLAEAQPQAGAFLALDARLDLLEALEESRLRLI